jgi:hypothetical protein
MVVFWDVAQCSLVDIDRRCRGAYCLHHRGDEKTAIFILVTVRTTNLTMYYIFLYSTTSDLIVIGLLQRLIRCALQYCLFTLSLFCGVLIVLPAEQ